MKPCTKIICVVTAVILAVVILISSVILLFRTVSDSYNRVELKGKGDKTAAVKLKDNVIIGSKDDKLKKNYQFVTEGEDCYTIVYKNALPDYFANMKPGEVFCVYPDENSDIALFNQGFSGKLKEIKAEDSLYYVVFTLPSVTEVFSDININIGDNGNISQTQATFYASENVTATHLPYDDALDSLSVYNTNVQTCGVKFDYKKPHKESLLSDYKLISKKLQLDFENKSKEDDDFKFKGKVTLENVAVKVNLDYHYDEETDTAQINNYALGIIAKRKINLGIKGEKTQGLDKLFFGEDKDLPVDIIISDVTSTEKEQGKVVLGTYLIGCEAELPALENQVNDVNILSIGIAVQLTLTAQGEVSLEYNVEESAFMQMEVNSLGENINLNKSYDYPNPTITSVAPTQKQIDSKPELKTEIKGEACANLAFGADIGLCILGMVPMKLTNNLLELEIEKSFESTLSDSEDSECVLNNYYLLDNNVDCCIVTSNTYFKMNFGVEIKFFGVDFVPFKTGGSYRLYEEFLFQYPPAIGFSHSQCGFGGVYLGEQYTDDEIDEAYYSFMKDTDNYSILASASDSLVGDMVASLMEGLDFNPTELVDEVSTDENYKITYFTSGVMYVRDTENTVKAVLITGENVPNSIGVCVGTTESKIKQVYSTADDEASLSFEVGFIVRSILGIEDLENISLDASTYYSCDSEESMTLLYEDEKVNLIILTN